MKIEHTTSSGNVFKDLGFEDHEERLAKSKLAIQIERIIDKRKLSQAEAAKLLGTTQPKISLLMNGHFEEFSIDRLMSLLKRLDQDIEIRVRPKPARRKTSAHLIAITVSHM